MIVVKRRMRGIPYVQKWFAHEPVPADAFSVAIYYQYIGKRRPAFFLRQPFAAVQIDLAREEDVVLSEMQKNVRYKIRRAEKDGLSWEIGVDPKSFADFHEAFAHKRGIEGVDISRLYSFGEALVLSRVVMGSQVLAQHAHLVDAAESRARMLYSSSARFDGVDASLVGRANCWCHWKEMVHFRGLGIRTYDLGGYAANATNSTLEGINEFKLGFGGNVVQEDHWLSPLYFLASLAGAR
jgi:hypothetical protein